MRTANASEMRLSALISTANIASVADGEWALISPYGDHNSPDGSYVQKFARDQAEKVVKTWNSITGTAARVFKNLWHGLGPKMTLPVWDGHPETDKQRWPMEKLLGEVTDLRTGNEGLEGRIKWSANSGERRTAGPLYPSPLWWHWPPAGEPPAVFPELLESIGLVPTPNISSVPAWTQNATLAGNAQAENQNENPMNEEQLKALRKALNLPESADSAKIIETAQSALQLSTSNATALTTANSAKADLETKLTTANSQVATLTTERDQLKTANGTLTTEVETLRTGILDLAEKKGVITAADRDGFKTKLTANATTALTELKDKQPVMNTKTVEINGNRLDLSTANARQTALENAVAKRMKDDGCTREQAWDRVQSDPNFAPLFGAMQDPTKKAAA